MKKYLLIVVIYLLSNNSHAQVWKKGKDNLAFPTVKVAQTNNRIFNLSFVKDGVLIQKSDNFGHTWSTLDTVRGSTPEGANSIDMIGKDTLLFVLCKIHPKTITLLQYGESGKKIREVTVIENTTDDANTDHLFLINKELWIGTLNGLFKFDIKKGKVIEISKQNGRDLVEHKGKLYFLHSGGKGVSVSKDKGKTWTDVKGLEENTNYTRLFNFRNELAIMSTKDIRVLRSEKWEIITDAPYSPQKLYIHDKMIYIYANNQNGLAEIYIYNENGINLIKTLSVPPGFVLDHILYHKDSLIAVVEWLAYRIKI